MGTTIEHFKLDGDQLEVIFKYESDLKGIKKFGLEQYDLMAAVQNKIVIHLTEQFLAKNANEILKGIDLVAVQNAIVLRSAERLTGSNR